MQARGISDLLDYVTSAIFVLHGIFIFDSNTAATHLSGYSKNELAGKPFLDLIDPKDQQKILSHCEECLSNPTTGHPSPLHVNLQVKGGGNCPAWLSVELLDANAPAWVITLWEPAETGPSPTDSQKLIQQIVGMQEGEQSRIARELHDQVGQSLAAISIGLCALEQSIQEGQADLEQLQRLKTITSQLGSEIHQIAYNLRPPKLEQKGFLEVLSDYLEEWSAQNHVQVNLYSGNVIEDTISNQVGFQLYRIIQEALTNIQRHASAQHVNIYLDAQPPHILMQVEDDGLGFEPEAQANVHRGQSMGLTNMQERAEIIGGEFTVQSEPGKGTRLVVSIPLS